MAYVIAEPCIGVKDTACVDACPVDCIICVRRPSSFRRRISRLPNACCSDGRGRPRQGRQLVDNQIRVQIEDTFMVKG